MFARERQDGLSRVAGVGLSAGDAVWLSTCEELSGAGEGGGFVYILGTETSAVEAGRLDDNTSPWRRRDRPCARPQTSISAVQRSPAGGDPCIACIPSAYTYDASAVAELTALPVFHVSHELCYCALSTCTVHVSTAGGREARGDAALRPSPSNRSAAQVPNLPSAKYMLDVTRVIARTLCRPMSRSHASSPNRCPGSLAWPKSVEDHERSETRVPRSPLSGDVQHAAS